jgi:hypothetical protein
LTPAAGKRILGEVGPPRKGNVVGGAEAEPDGDRPVRSSRGLPGGAIERVVTDNLEEIVVQSRGLVVVAGISALAAIILTFQVDDALVRVTGLLVFLALMLVIVWLVFQMSTAAAGEGVEGGHAEVAAAIAVVHGQWWQLVLDDASPGISVLTVALSVLPNRHRLCGRKYSERGRQTSSWDAAAVGLVSIHPVKVFYLWEGGYAARIDRSLVSASRPRHLSWWLGQTGRFFCDHPFELAPDASLAPPHGTRR